MTATPSPSVSSTSTTHASQQRPPIWRNVGVLKWAIQLLVLFLVIFAFWFLATEAADNLDASGIPVDYEWVDGPANIQLSEGVATTPDTAGRALWSGMVTTIRLAVIGIIASTILGLIIGLARLSHNWVASRAASVYIETIRNIPVLVQILLWFAILTALGELSGGDDPDTAEVEGATGPIPGWLIVSKKGISLPRVFLADGFYQWAVFVLAGIVVALVVRRRIIKRQEVEGGSAPRASVPLAIVAAFAVVGWFANPLVGFLEHVFSAIADLWDAIPQALMQTALSVIAIAVAVWWIRRFLESRRTPAGLAKLTDDDWFRMIFAGFAALVVVFFVWQVWPGLSSWIINSGRDFWNLAADKFGSTPDGSERGLRPLDGMKPAVTTGRFTNYAPTGWTLTVFAGSLLFGLVLYTASFIAEIVRGGILAVPTGQTEAASALGLSRAQSLRFVILPQAFRVIMPPLGNQYLNITKNTSLAIAVGLSDIVQVGQSVYNKNNQTLAVFGIWMAFFLTLSLTISAVVNFINGRLAIVER